MVIKKSGCKLSVCKVRDYSQVNSSSKYCFLGKTDEAYSLVCLTDDVPANTLERDDGWAAFWIESILDFSLIAIFTKISAILTENQIGLLVVSAYNTDYVLIKQENFLRAL